MKQLKGAIEAASKDLVSGWIAAPGGSLRGERVQAFLHDVCIGEGRIEVFRQDLADAGLGDGFAGFAIGTLPMSARDQMSVTVRVQGSDFQLIRMGARVGGGGAEQGRAASHMEPPALQWMMARGWLRQFDHDFLKFFRRLGIYERSLLAQADEMKDRKPLDTATVVRASLELLALSELKVEKQQVKTMNELDRLLTTLRSDGRAVQAVALWSADRARFLVREASHDGADEAVISPLVEYALGPDRLLLVASRLQLDLDQPLPPGGLLVYSGSPAA